MSGQTLVFLHGWLMGPEMWAAQADALASQARCALVTQPGHGADALAGPRTMDAWTDAVVRHLDETGVDRAVFVGHSMGGFVCQEMWARHPQRVAGLALVGTSDQEWGEEQRAQFIELVDTCAAGWSEELASTIAGFLMGSAFLGRHPDWLDAWRRRVATEYDLGVIAELGRVVAGHRDYSATNATVSVPAVVVHGSDDQAIPSGEGRALAGRIPTARFVELPGCGHAPALEAPDAVTAAISGVLDGGYV